MQTIKQDGKRTIGEASLEAQLLHERLSKADFGEEITYAELSEVAGRNVQTTAFAALQTARRRCENQNQIVFGVIRGIGLRRLLNEEIPQSAQNNIDHIRRTAKRTARRLACVDYNALPRQLQNEHNTKLSILGALTELSKPSGGKLLEQRINSEQKALPIGKTLELFIGR